jgi:hypothetical protein
MVGPAFRESAFGIRFSVFDVIFMFLYHARRPADSGQNESANETGVRSNFNAGDGMIGLNPSPPLRFRLEATQDLSHTSKILSRGREKSISGAVHEMGPSKFVRYARPHPKRGRAWRASRVIEPLSG